jgi:uncharacterized protein (TIGR02444 family)
VPTSAKVGRSLFPASPFWDFSLRLYARPGVAAACLRLQERHGIDVNILFCCLWLGMAGQVATRRDVVRMIARVRTLHEQVVKPLRAARTALKRILAAETGEHLAAAGALRVAIKKGELDAEHLEQVILTAMHPTPGGAAARAAGPALAEANTAAYLAVLRARPGRRDRADLACILAALGAEAAAGSGGARAPRLGRRRPLARAG